MFQQIMDRLDKLEKETSDDMEKRITANDKAKKAADDAAKQPEPPAK